MFNSRLWAITRKEFIQIIRDPRTLAVMLAKFPPARLREGDVVLTMSVSGNSPNLVKAIEWANQNGLHTVALVGGKRGRLAEIAQQVIVINDTHYGRVEDAHMGICHMLCYAFMENPEMAKQP